MDEHRLANLHRVDQPDGGTFIPDDEVDKLTLCCCECCHCQACEWLSKKCCYAFPQHNTANQFFTSRMFSAYQEEGNRACEDANAVGFLKGEREQSNCV